MEETPTGIMIKPDSLEKLYDSTYTGDEIGVALSMLLLSDHGIITIPAVGMPGASKTLRFDLASRDAERLEPELLREAIEDAVDKLSGIISDRKMMEKLILGS